jgi:hypothetical protein
MSRRNIYPNVDVDGDHVSFVLVCVPFEYAFENPFSGGYVVGCC